MNKSLVETRKTVFKIIEAVLRKNSSFDEALDAELKTNKFDLRDRGFVRMLATTTLRRLGQIDDILGRFLEHSIPKRALPVEDILRIGIAQIVFLKTPAHASVDTSVKLAETLNLKPYKGLINAVLRKVAKDGLAIVEKQDEARLNTPEWLWLSWQNSYGKDICRKIALANLVEPNLDITVKKNPKEWAEKLGGELLPTDTIRLKNAGTITELEGFESGDWWVQDASASIPVRLLGNVKNLNAADLCSAPGGKTAQLINYGAVVTAVDRSDNRIKKMKENLKRLGFSCEIIASDIEKWFDKKIKNKKDNELFDVVLLDAPCSSTGTIRRNPDIAILKTTKDIAKINSLQIKLLSAAFKMVKKGGIVVYSVCSLQKEEGEDCVEHVLKQHENIIPHPIKEDEVKEINKACENALITKDGYLRTMPFYMNGVDGFFAARFMRKV